ncbi:hypothetical protein MMC13_005251 [Lambiella insularis]|nr:hypothetical protein [Lambiella insularis]
MSFLASAIESTLGYLLQSVRGHDEKLFCKAAPFSSHPEPTLTVMSPYSDHGPTGSPLHSRFSLFGGNEFPPLEWTLPDDLKASGKVKEYILACEDPDAPFPQPILHGLYHGIPGDKTATSNVDFEPVNPGEPVLKGGFKLGRNRRGTIWSGPRPVMGHGPHRYFFQVVALGEVLGLEKGKAKDGLVTKDELLEKMEGKVLGWGMYVGTFESKRG